MNRYEPATVTEALDYLLMAGFRLCENKPRGMSYIERSALGKVFKDAKARRLGEQAAIDSMAKSLVSVLLACAKRRVPRADLERIGGVALMASNWASIAPGSRDVESLRACGDVHEWLRRAIIEKPKKQEAL